VTDFGLVSQIAVDAEGFVVIARSSSSVWNLSLRFPGYSSTSTLIVSDDGAEVYVFNGKGRHIRTLNSLTGGTLLEFAYDAQGRLFEIEDGDGNVTRIERDLVGNATAFVGPFGDRTLLTIGPEGYLEAIENPAGELREFDYEPLGLLIRARDPRGNESEYAYDTLGRLMLAENAAGGSQDLTRDDFTNGAEVTKTTVLGRATRYQVERLGNQELVTRNTLPDGTIAEMSLRPDASATVVAADGTTLETVSGPDPRFGMRDAIEERRTTTTPFGLSRTVETSREVTLADPQDLFSVSTVVERLTVNGRESTKAFDTATRRFTLTTPEARRSFQTIDMLGRTIDMRVDGLEATGLSYDTRGRLAAITQGSGADTRIFAFTYHPTSGFLETVTDPLGRVTSYTQDLTGRVTSQTLPGGRTIGFSYDPNGNLTAVTPPGRTAHSFEYTPVDLTSEYDPPDIGGTDATTYAYSLDRDLELITRPDGQTIDLVHGAMTGRLDSMVAPTGTTTYGYDATTGKLTSLSAPGGQNLGYSYDGSLLLSEEWSGVITGTASRAYDSDFRISELSVNGDNPIGFSYDADSLLVWAGDEALTRHPEHGLITETTLGVVTDTWDYNSFGELQSYVASQNSAQIFATTFTRDKLGRIETKTETVDATTDTYVYDYDDAGRLEGVEKNGLEIARYTYDFNGNRETYVGQLGEVTDAETTYDAQDRLISYGDLTYTYTANGELQTKTAGSALTSYQYDVFGNLRAVELPDGTDVEYVIDGRNRRVGKKVNGTLVQGFLYQDQLNPIAELDGAGNVVSRFVYGNRANVPDYMVKGGATYRIISDHLGSPRLVVDSTSGAIVQRLDYDEFGNVISDTNPGFQPFGFAGGIYDQHTKLARFGARDYDAETGRWTAKDPILFDGGDTNLYGYVLNDPVNFVDPAGMARDSVTAALEQAVAEGNVAEIETILQAAGQGLRGSVQNPGLKDALSNLFRPQDLIPGGTAGALQKAIEKGIPDLGHLQKATERAQQLRKLIEKGLCGSDEAVAKGVLQNLEKAIRDYLNSGL